MFKFSGVTINHLQVILLNPSYYPLASPKIPVFQKLYAYHSFTGDLQCCIKYLHLLNRAVYFIQLPGIQFNMCVAVKSSKKPERLLTTAAVLITFPEPGEQ